MRSRSEEWAELGSCLETAGGKGARHVMARGGAGRGEQGDGEEGSEHEGHESIRNTRKDVLSASRLSCLSQLS
jgi:hypothetical protein